MFTYVVSPLILSDLALVGSCCQLHSPSWRAGFVWPDRKSLLP